MIVILSITVAVLSTALIVLSTRKVGAVGSKNELMIPVTDRKWTKRKLRALRQEIYRQNLAIAEGIERVTRAEQRIKKTVTSAKKLVRDSGLHHPGLEAEIDELRERNGEGSGGVEVPQVREDVAPDPPVRLPARLRKARVR